MTSYEEFVASKLRAVEPAGFDVPAAWLPGCLKPIQRDAVRWGLRMGRAGVFYDTGLGKSLIELVAGACIARETGGPVVLFEPLGVVDQIVREAVTFGVRGVGRADSAADVTGPGVYVANYEKLHRFAGVTFAGAILGEASILKSHDGKTRTALIDRFAATPYKLVLTATPSPNDHEELGNYAEFLGVMSRTEMLATYFKHDSGNTSEWRLKGHAESEFWKWVGSWALVARRPSDLGHDDAGYDLPPLSIEEHRVACEAQPGQLFATAETTLTGQRSARRKTLGDRVQLAADLAMDPAAPGKVVIWCELNDEQDALEDLLDDECVSIRGTTPDDDKVARERQWREGDVGVLVTKPAIFGHGMNWQHCSRMVFVGLTHSYEQFYQAVRRCWRYGQTRPVAVHVVTSDLESAVLENVKAKQRDHEQLFDSMLAYTRGVNRDSLRGTRKMVDTYERATEWGTNWVMHLGDAVDVIRDRPADSIHYTLFSPPFDSLYTYSNTPRDMGNSRDTREFFAHFRFLIPELLRVTIPGRLLSLHCTQIPLMKERDGVIGRRDFRGELVAAFVAAGWIFHSEICIAKSPVVEMQRTKAIGLLHKQVKKDSCMSRQGTPDYVLTFRKPGENPEPVAGMFEEYVGTRPPPPNPNPESWSIEVWQKYADHVWLDIDQTRVLNNYKDGRTEKDERHVCPLQLDVIARCLDLWTNPGDVVLSPFAGIGSEGYESVRTGRRFVGVELKRSYFDVAVKNLTRAAEMKGQRGLFDDVDDAA